MTSEGEKLVAHRQFPRGSDVSLCASRRIVLALPTCIGLLSSRRTARRNSPRTSVNLHVASIQRVSAAPYSTL